MFAARSIFGLALCTTLSISLQAQDSYVTQPRADQISSVAPMPKKSPMNSASVRSADGAYARVVYSQPMLRGRDMLGQEVPFGKVWRLGANEATELFTTAALDINGKTLPAGAYSLYAIPSQDKWELIFSNDLGQWGAYNYDADKDALRVDVPVQRGSESYEAFSIWFEANTLHMAWGTSHVVMPFSFQQS